jgi:signal transduction histidine kinase
MRLNKFQINDGKGANRREKKSVTNASKGIVQAIRKVTDWLRGTFKRVSFETNDDYRRFFLASDISQARIVIFLLAVTIVLFAISDYMFFGFSLKFYVLAALRLALIVYSIAHVRYIGRVKNYRSYDVLTLTYLLVVVIGILLVNSTRPQNFLPHIIVIDAAVFVFYLVIPVRFIYQALPSLIFSIGEVLIIMLSFGSFEMSALFTALFSLLFANVIALLSSLRLHSYRWWIFQDVLERKETERLVAIGQTAGMVGHDIRNPLQAITSELYLAKEAIANSPHIEDRTQALESINLIEEQTDYISKIVSDLQDYARPLKPEYSEINLSELVVSVFQTISIPDKIVLKIDVKGFPKIKTDPTLIKRILTNLINNAIQAMPNGGILELTAYKKDSKAVITVSDTGKGIPEEIKPKLFTPLFTTKAKGQGLGLAVVKRLVVALHGSISFESQEGKGTKFTIELQLEA